MNENVYREFVHLENLVMMFGALLILLITLQIVAKTIIFAWVVKLLRKVEMLLNLVEGHARITDSRGNRVMEEVKDVRHAATAAAVAAAEVSRKVDEVPELVATKIKNGVDSGIQHAVSPSDPNINLG